MPKLHVCQSMHYLKVWTIEENWLKSISEDLTAKEIFPVQYQHCFNRRHPKVVKTSFKILGGIHHHCRLLQQTGCERSREGDVKHCHGLNFMITVILQQGWGAFKSSRPPPRTDSCLAWFPSVSNLIGKCSIVWLGLILQLITRPWNAYCCTYNIIKCSPATTKLRSKFFLEEYICRT